MNPMGIADNVASLRDITFNLPHATSSHSVNDLPVDEDSSNRRYPAIWHQH